MENKTLDNLRPLTDEELQSANWDEDNYCCRPL